MTDNSKKVFLYLRKCKKEGLDVFDEVVARMTGLSQKTVNGIFTRSIQMKGYGTRVSAEIELEDGTHRKVKMLELNDLGMTVDLDEC